MNTPTARAPRPGTLRCAALYAALIPCAFLAAGCAKKPENQGNPPSGVIDGTAPDTVAETVLPKPAQPLTEPYYPPESRRAGETGTVELRLHVLSSGAIDDVAVAKSSGHPALDEYAVREARTRWRMKPGMQHGKPVAMWHNFRVKYKIAD